jgi:hypothetical protein
MRTAWRGWGRSKADIATVLILAALLNACGGGGGGGGGGAADTPTPPATATAASTPTFTVPSTAAPTATVPPPTDTPEPTITPELGTPTLTPTLEPSATEPQPTATPTPLIGPVVTAFGLADSTGTFNRSTGTDDSGRPIYPRVGGDDFIVYVEGRPGVSRLPVGTGLLSTQLDNPVGQPDVQMVSSRALGNGSSAVCDKAFPVLGGVPAVEPPDFGFVQTVSDALNDMSCRFRVFTESDFACTQDNSGTYIFGNGGSTVQFCALVSDSLTFPDGDTVLSVRLRDTAGQAGPPMQIVVRVR